MKLSAHELIHDSNGKYSSNVHFAPNDDPKTDETTVIHFDIDQDLDLTESKISLFIIGPNGKKVELQAQPGIHTAAATYNFPSSGKYYFTLEIIQSTSSTDKISFNFSQQVANNILVAHHTSQAEIIWFGVSSVAVILLCVVYFRHSKS